MRKRVSTAAAFVAVFLAMTAAFAAPTASIDFIQGATNPPAGQAIGAVTGASVTVSNGSNVSVASWQIELYDVPPNSALATGVIASNNNSATPSASFTPDVAGTYRIALKVWNLINRVGTATDMDIRDVIIGLPNTGVWVPPLQTWPRPLPPLASAYVGAKASESNLSGCDRGWDGCGTDGGLRNLIILVDARLPSATEKAVLDAGSTAGVNMYEASNAKAQAALWDVYLPTKSTISDADTTINVSTASSWVMASVTANRVVTLGTSGSPLDGEVLIVKVTRTSAFTVTVKDDAGTTLVVVPASVPGTVVAKYSSSATHFAAPSFVRTQ